jgi:curved DNA-binding protein CbpA
MRVLDSYKVLQIAFGANMEEITAAYRKLSRENHPDLNPGEEFEERMKDINVAYSTLCDDLALRQKVRQRVVDVGKAKVLSEDERACEALRCYFEALVASDYERAYSMLSSFDKTRISPAAFADWRESVEMLYIMLNFAIGAPTDSRATPSQKGGEVKAKRFSVSVTVKDKLTGEVQTEQSDKVVVCEGGVWRCFLGYGDIGRLSDAFREKMEEERKKEFERDWQRHREERDGALGVLSLKGIVKAAERPVYEHKRYKKPFVVLAVRVSPSSSLNKNRAAFVMRSACDSLAASVRLTDEIGFTGNGVFIVLLSTMKKRFIGTVSRKLEHTVKEHVFANTGERVEVQIASYPYGGEDVGTVIDSLIKKVCNMR